MRKIGRGNMLVFFFYHKPLIAWSVQKMKYKNDVLISPGNPPFKSFRPLLLRRERGRFSSSFVGQRLMSVSSFVILLILLFSIQLYAQSYIIKTVITEETEIDQGSDLRISVIESHNLSINNNGAFIFSASLQNTPDGSNPRGIILFSEGEVKLLVKGNSTSSVSEKDFHDVSSPDINDDGTVVFCGTSFLPGEIIKSAIYKLGEDKPVAVISPGDQVQGLDATIKNVDCDGPRQLSLNNNGDIAFNATLSDGRSGLFLFTEEYGIKPVILEGDSLPGFKGSKTLTTWGAVINDKREIAFVETQSGIFLFRQGGIVPIKLPGERAPGTNEMVFWNTHISPITLGNNSEVVFRGDYIVPGGDSNKFKDRRGMGLFLWSEGDTDPLILTGNEVLGIEGRFLIYKGSLTKDAINDQGEIVASLSITKDSSGLYLISDVDIIPVFLTKDNPLGTEKIILTGTAGINNRGDIVFFGRDIQNNDMVFLAIKK